MRWLLALLLIVGCGRGDHGVVLWHAYTGKERVALEHVVRVWNDYQATTEDQKITLVAVPYDAFADKLSSAIPRGNGPDLLIYAQDRIGDWADAGAIEPVEFWVDDALADQYSRESLGALAYHGSLYGLPLATKSLVLYYNPAIIKTPPKTTDDVLALAQQLHPKGIFALAYPNVDLYTHAPWLHGYGGRVMDDNGTLTVATPEAANAMRFARELVTSGATPDDAQGSMIGSFFNEGRAATVISGPWFINDIDAGVSWRVAPLPVVSATGQPARPFRSTESVMMSAHAHDKDAAFTVMHYLTSDEAAKERVQLAQQIVPNVHVWDNAELANDPVLSVFRAQSAQAVDAPNQPSMRTVWTPYRTALGEVIAGRADAAAKLESLQRELAGYAR
ncbi:MAG: extracellular solute-binding protein [Kofleriaceae bacterium]